MLENQSLAFLTFQDFLCDLKPDRTVSTEADVEISTATSSTEGAVEISTVT